MHIALCLTGKTFSHYFLQCWTQLLHVLLQERIETDIRLHPHLDPYMERNLCLGGPRDRDANQMPFESLPPDIIVWIDSKSLFTPDQVKMLISDTKYADLVAAITPHDKFSYSAITEKETLSSYVSFGEIENFVKEKPRSLMDVEFVDLGLSAMRYGIFEKIAYPWYSPELFTTTHRNEVLSVDFSMCQKVRQLGYRVCIDPTIRFTQQRDGSGL